MIRFCRSLFLSFLFAFALFSLSLFLNTPDVKAGACYGSYQCRLWETSCVNDLGQSPCQPGPADPTCVCTEFCPATYTSFSCSDFTGVGEASCNLRNGFNQPYCNPAACDASGNFFCGWGCSSDSECPGCQACDTSSGVCYDSNIYCPVGQTCSGAVCQNPPAVCGNGPPAEPGEACDYGAGNDTQNLYQGGDVAGCGADPGSICDAGCGTERFDSSCDLSDNCACGGTDWYMSSVNGACLSTPVAACGTPTPTPTPTATPIPPTATPTPVGPCGPANCGACGTQATCTAQSCNWCGASCQSAACPTATPIPPTPTPTPFCGDGTCNGSETNATCPADCPAVTYTISGNVYVDANGNGVQDCVGACTNGAGDELNYSGATVSRTPSGSTTTNASGNYTFSGLGAGTYTITLTLPPGYGATTANPVNRTVGPNQTANFGIEVVPAPVCVGGLSANPTTVDAGLTSTLSVTTCSDVENPDDGSPPPPFNWNPDTSGNCPGASFSGQTDTATSSTVTWTAPSCAASTLTCTPQVTVGGAGGTTNYGTSITVPETYTLDVNIREVASLGSCTAASGNPYNTSTVNINVTGGNLPVGGVTQGTATGATSFTCLAAGNYQTAISPPSGYSVVGTDGGTSSSGNTIDLAPLSGNSTLTFCIAPTSSWFQTDRGNVRFLNLSNTIPSGQYGASDSSNPGIYYSSSSDAVLGNGTVSAKGWVVNNEYSYNANTKNRNGTMGYGFLKSRARKVGVSITPLTAGTLSENEITGTGIYESDGDLTINTYNHIPGRRVVILVNGNVTINENFIEVPKGGGVFILAAKGNITIAKTIGTATLTSTTSNIDGYYTAEGSIIIDGDTCADGTTSDLRLNVGGALVANALKPFSETGTGIIQNKRSLCTNNLLYPSLFVSSRPDFLTQLTDFYKVSYTKWREEKP